MVQLVSEYVQLEQRGPDDFWGCCPFHDEKSPSFHIRPGRGLFKCFGCGKGGDVFRFVEETEGLSFPDAIRSLAQRVGVTLESASPEERARDERRAELQRVSNLVASFYEEVLWSDTPAGEKGRAYLQQRGISDETAREFRLGVAPPEWQAVVDFANHRQLHPQILVELGLIRVKDNGRAYDFFRDRLMFPILSEQGKVVAFGGRTLCDDERKYMNSREVPGFYEKRRFLYGLDKAKGSRPQRLVVVEGYMDVIGPHQVGRREFVAALGTAFTEEQAKLARRYVDEVVLLFDGDEAGTAATLRALANLVGQQGLTIKVARLPSGQDPDEIVQRDPALLDRILDDADDVIAFLIEQTLEGRDVASPAGRERAIRAGIRLLARIPDPIRLSTELGLVAERFGLPEEVLREELARERRGQQAPRRRTRGRPESDRHPEPVEQNYNANDFKGLELRLLESLLAVPHAAAKVVEEGLGTPEAFPPGPLRTLAAAIFAEASEQGDVEPSRVLGRVEHPAARDLLSDIIGRLDQQSRRISLEKDHEAELQGLRRLMRRAQEQRLKQIGREIRQAKDQETRDRLLAELAAARTLAQ
jgi:DNA primase